MPVHGVSGPSGLRPGEWPVSALVDTMRGCGKMSLYSFRVSEIPEARFQKLENSSVSNQENTARGAVWSIRAQATVRKPLFPDAKLVRN